MKKYSRIWTTLLVLLLLGACHENNTPKEEAIEDMVVEKETHRVSREINENYGGLLKSIKYTLPVNKINFSIEGGLRKDSSVAIRFNYYIPLTFDEHLVYQEELLDTLFNDFNKKNVSSIYLGRLIYTGDLAVQLSKEVVDQEWDGSSYPDLIEILDASSLAARFEPLLSPFGLQVNTVSFEKAFFIEKARLDQYSVLSTPESEIPEKILDCQTWLILAPTP